MCNQIRQLKDSGPPSSIPNFSTEVGTLVEMDKLLFYGAGILCTLLPQDQVVLEIADPIHDFRRLRKQHLH